MSALDDDLPLDTGREADVMIAPSAPSSPGPRIIVAAALAIALAAAAWMFIARSRPASTVGQSGAAAVEPTTPVDPALEAARALPPLAGMDPVVRGLLSAISTQPAMLQWLASDDLVGAIATAIARLAAGDTPARDLAVLKPSQLFATTGRGGATRIDPASFGRYDSLVTAVTSADSAKLAAAFSAIKPRVVEAFAAQGHDSATFDQALARAIGIVVSTPDVPAEAAVTPGVGGYAYANPDLERLPSAQRHLIRMGPAHASAVRDATRRFADAIGVTPVRP